MLERFNKFLGKFMFYLGYAIVYMIPIGLFVAVLGMFVHIDPSIGALIIAFIAGSFILLVVLWFTAGPLMAVLDKKSVIQDEAVKRAAKDLSAQSPDGVPKLNRNQWESAILTIADKELKPLVLEGKPIEEVHNDMREEIAGASDKLLNPAEGKAIVEFYSRYYSEHPTLYAEAASSASVPISDYVWAFLRLFVVISLFATIAAPAELRNILLIIILTLFLAIKARQIIKYRNR